MLVQRDAMLARYMLLSCVSPSVCPSASLSHAGIVPKWVKRLNVGSRKQRRQFFWRQRSRRNSNWVTRNERARQSWGRLKSAIFDQYPAISQKRCKTGI